ncbi:MAG: hypothetical protein M1830_010719 [Pleopsidium flavum]|nr:MAG: hypothetical protein M1830_010719 [Pleopsidium flavum]
MPAECPLQGPQGTSVGFFDPISDLNTKLVEVRDSKKIYHNVLSFTDHIRLKATMMNTVTLRKDLETHLLGKADNWYTKELNHLSRLGLQSVNLEEWCKALENQFRDSPNPVNYVQSIVLHGKNSKIAADERAQVLLTYEHMDSKLRLHLSPSNDKSTVEGLIESVNLLKNTWFDIYARNQLTVMTVNRPQQYQLQSGRNRPFQPANARFNGNYSPHPFQPFSYDNRYPYNNRVPYGNRFPSNNYPGQWDNQQLKQPCGNMEEPCQFSSPNQLLGPRQPPQITLKVKKEKEKDTGSISKHLECRTCLCTFTSNNQLHKHIRTGCNHRKPVQVTLDTTSPPNPKITALQLAPELVSTPSITAVTTYVKSTANEASIIEIPIENLVTETPVESTVKSTSVESAVEISIIESSIGSSFVDSMVESTSIEAPSNESSFVDSSSVKSIESATEISIENLVTETRVESAIESFSIESSVDSSSVESSVDSSSVESAVEISVIKSSVEFSSVKSAELTKLPVVRTIATTPCSGMVSMSLLQTKCLANMAPFVRPTLHSHGHGFVFDPGGLHSLQHLLFSLLFTFLFILKFAFPFDTIPHSFQLRF